MAFANIESASCAALEIGCSSVKDRFGQAVICAIHHTNTVAKYSHTKQRHSPADKPDNPNNGFESIKKRIIKLMIGRMNAQKKPHRTMRLLLVLITLSIKQMINQYI